MRVHNGLLAVVVYQVDHLVTGDGEGRITRAALRGNATVLIVLDALIVRIAGLHVLLVMMTAVVIVVVMIVVVVTVMVVMVLVMERVTRRLVQIQHVHRLHRREQDLLAVVLILIAQ